jgi:hypothetical protein
MMVAAVMAVMTTQRPQPLQLPLQPQMVAAGSTLTHCYCWEVEEQQ